MKLLASIATAALLSAPAASAATLDFVAFGAGYYGASISLPEATITNGSGGSILVGAGSAGQANGFCGISSGCESDVEIAFTSAVKNLMFQFDGSDPGDSVLLSIFGLSNALLGSINFTTPDAPIDLTSFGTITRLFFDDSSTGNGVGYSNFTFDIVDASPIPVPASLPLLALGLGAMGLFARRRKA